MFKDIFDVAKADGISHFRFWFQPLDRFISPNPDSYLSWNSELIHLDDLEIAEHPFENGYLKIDTNAKPFVDHQGICIPALYFSNGGDPLDLKIPLLKSLEKIQGVPEIEIEQSFYLINEEMLTGDLVEVGHRVFQFTENIAVDQTRVSLFLQDLKQNSIELEISRRDPQFTIKQRKGECITSIDQNIQGMELVKKIAKKNRLGALFSEKPFGGLPNSSKTIRWSLNSPPEVIEHALKEHAKFIQASLSCFNLDPRMSGIHPKIAHQGNEIIIQGLSPNAHPALAICAIQAAVGDSSQLKNKTSPVVSEDLSPFTDPRTQRAFAYILKTSDLQRLEEMSFSKYVVSIKGIISSMVRQFEEEILPLLMTLDVSARAFIEKEIVELNVDINHMGPEIQAKVFRELMIPKILKAKLNLEKFVNHYRI
jgi:hypothetical protein